MILLFQTISLLSAASVGGLVSAIWEGAVLAACVALCLCLLPGLGAASRSLVWMNVFLLLVLLHIFPFLGEPGATSGVLHRSSLHFDPLWSLVIAGVWTMLSLWRAAQLISSAIRLRGLAARATCVWPDALIQGLLGKPGRGAELCTSTEVERPCVIGFFRPRILLPSALFEQLNQIDLQQVVLHEMEHLRRADDWTNLLQKIGVVLFPLNPVLLWVEHRLCMEREFACDDRVLRSSCERKAYALCLTRLAEFTMLNRSISLALGAWERRSELARRIHRILRRRNEKMSGRLAMALTGGLTIGVLSAAIVLARSPQIVSFAPLAQSNLQARGLPASALRPMSAGESGGYPILVKAVMPQRWRESAPFSMQAAPVSSHRRVMAPKPSLRPTQIIYDPPEVAVTDRPEVKSRTVSDSPEVVVLTEWQVYGQPSSIVLAIDRVHRSSFAAVAIANGWLIVQI